MDPPDDRQQSQQKITDWELAKVNSIVRRFPQIPAEELQAQLLARLLELNRYRSTIRYWKAYCATSLRHEASKFARRWRTRQREVTLSQIEGAEEQADRQEAFFGADVPQEDLRIAFRTAWAELPRELRQFWQLLDQEGGNQVRVAKRLGKHRNTIRLWTRKIRELLRQHGFE